MPTEREREYYRLGFQDGQKAAVEGRTFRGGIAEERIQERESVAYFRPKPKRKLSAWNKFVRANSKKKIYRYRNGKLNLKKMGVAFRKKRR